MFNSQLSSSLNSPTNQQSIHNLLLLNQQYDADAIPGNFDLAKIHQKANIVAPDYELKKLKKIPDLCPCCSRQVQRKTLPMHCPVEKLAFLGSGYPLFFQFVKQCQYILWVFLFIVGVFNMYANYKGSDCIKNPYHLNSCFKTWFSRYSLGNRIAEQIFYDTTQWLDLLLIVAMMITMFIIRWEHKLFENELDEKQLSATDYTLLVENIIPNSGAIDYIQDFKQFLEQNILPDQHVEIHKVIFLTDLSELIKLNNEKNTALHRKQTKLGIKKSMNDELSDYELEELNNDIEEIARKIKEYKRSCQIRKDQEFLENYLLGSALVIFKYEKDKQDVLDRYSATFFESCTKHIPTISYNGQKLSLMQSTEPSDIEWYNLHLSRGQKYLRRFISYVCSLIFLFICYTIVVSILENQKGYISKIEQTGKSRFWIPFVQVIVPVTIFILNQLLRTVLDFFAKFERFSTNTFYKVSLARKLSVAQFLNTSITIFIIRVVFPGAWYSIGNVFGHEQLVAIQNEIFLFYIIFPFLQNLFSLNWITKLWNRSSYEKNKEQSVLSQKQLNELYEGHNFDIPQRYAMLFNTMFSTIFYTPIMPFVLIYGIISIFFQYVSLKYILLRRSTVKSLVSSQLPNEMIELLEYCLPLYIGSNFLFQIYFRLSTNDSHEIGHLPNLYYVAFALGIIYLILPIQDVVDMIVPSERANTQSYDQVELDFDTDYDRENPITAAESKKAYSEKIKRTKSITAFPLGFNSSEYSSIHNW